MKIKFKQLEINKNGNYIEMGWWLYSNTYRLFQKYYKIQIGTKYNLYDIENFINEYDTLEDAQIAAQKHLEKQILDKWFE